MKHSDNKNSLNALKLLQILQRNTDIDVPRLREELLADYEDEFDEKISASTFDRYIRALDDFGFEIDHRAKKGYYLASREFENSELHLLASSVLCNSYLTKKQVDDLLEKLKKLAGCSFDPPGRYTTMSESWRRSSNPEYFLNIETVNEAIACRCKLRYSYYKFDETKQLRKTGEYTVSPYTMVIHNQRTYLMAFCEQLGHMVFHRIDKIKGMALLQGERIRNLRSIPGYEEGINYRYLSSALPYMYSDEPREVVFSADAAIADDIIDWFGCGENVIISRDKTDPSKLTVSIKTSPSAIEHWAMQYINYVEIKEPAFLREKIKKSLSEGLRKYSSAGAPEKEAQNE